MITSHCEAGDRPAADGIEIFSTLRAA